MKHFYYAIVIILFNTNSSFSQGFDLGTWNILNIKYSFNDKLSFFAEGQLRSLKFYNHFHYYEYKGGINYKVHKSVKLTLGAGNYQTYKEGGSFILPKNNNEFRLWPQITLFHEIKNIRIEQRYRAELRWTSSGYRNRFRYRIGLSYQFGKEKNGFKPFQTSISNEIFFTDKEPYFERNRIQLTFNYKPSRSSTIQIGYLHQFDYKINDETGRDFLVIGFYYELFRKSTSKAKTDNELKDN
jgi:long-subunit fatty acid transport protein